MEHQNKTLIEIYAEQEKLATQERMVAQLKEIADAAKEQATVAKKRAEIAEQEAQSATADAQSAKRQSQINTWIAVAAVIVALLAWLIPSEMIYSAICAFFQPH